MGSTLRIASEQITSEILDGEVMIVNLETGSYYSMTGPGAEIWQCLQAGSRREEILEWLTRHYEVNAGQIESKVQGILDQLLEEKLIRTDENPESNPKQNYFSEVSARRPFSDPTFNKYTDRQELLLLDPIHDVDEAGWPLAKDLSDN